MIKLENLIKTLKNKEFLMYYYGNIYNNNDYTENNVFRTSKTIDYLQDCGFNYLEIIRELSLHKEKEINGQNLNDNLWKNSLIKRNAFYLHKELRLVSKAPEFNFLEDTIKSYSFYCEMKIRYTTSDVLQYFESCLTPFNRQFLDKKTDTKTVQFLIKKYSKIDYVEPLDIILCSIDHYTKENPDCTKLIEITSDNLDVVKHLQENMLELEAKDLRRITWR